MFIRVTLVLVGALAVSLACMVGGMGDVFDIGKKLTAAFGGPLLAVFLLALFDKRSTGTGVLISAILATISTLVLMYTQDWFSVWYWPIGFSSSIILGIIVSRCLPAQPSKFTYQQIMNSADCEVEDEVSGNDRV